MPNHVDVLIVGAGISGISAAYYLQKECPTKSVAILERRDAIGGTWDLFRYPGIRSDSDMYTLGFAFKPWEEAKAIADGPSILKYVRETARENGIDKKINFGCRVVAAHWSSEEALWTVEVERTQTGETEFWTCNFFSVCAGYYNYDNGYTPSFPGREQFNGKFIHPQHWPEDLDYAGKRVVVIGSGATAVTIVPEMAKKAAHVTMLQRSPSYVMSHPSQDWIANGLRKILPAKLCYGLIRWRNIILQLAFFKLSRGRPKAMKKKLIEASRAELPEGFPVEKHLTPAYNPWEQRLCIVPDGDLFKVISDGDASIVTDHIETFTADGLTLKSGETLDADIIVSATGLDLQVLGGADLYVDDRKIEPGDLMTYRGMLYSDVPNMSVTFGYTNASWTLKADLTSEFLCRLINHMDDIGAVAATPRVKDNEVEKEPFLDFSSGYFQRAEDRLPKQGSKKPWRLNQNYALDILALRYSKLDDGILEFTMMDETAVASEIAAAAE